MKELKPIQITVTPKTNHNLIQYGVLVIALCDDGSIWEFEDKNQTWWKLPAIKTKED